MDTNIFPITLFTRPVTIIAKLKTGSIENNLDTPYPRQLPENIKGNICPPLCPVDKHISVNKSFTNANK